MTDPRLDHDGDGISAAAGDCDDADQYAFPGAPEACDGRDNDCDGATDEGFDEDGDFWTTCLGDCRDRDPDTNPGAREIVDGLDNDCNGLADDGTEVFDDDGDGWSEDQGDCNDDPIRDGALIGPGAIEVALDEDGQPEGVDNDCDGDVDEALPACPRGGPTDDPTTYANALGACHFLTRARFSAYPMSPRSRTILPGFGDAIAPRTGADLVVLSTGIAGDTGPPGPPMEPGPSRDLSGDVGMELIAPHPDPLPDPLDFCGFADPETVLDMTALRLDLVVPSNARGFAFDFIFLSTEFPEYVCSRFDDTFLAKLESQAFTGNVSFDAIGQRVSINVGFFDVCDTALHPRCTGDALLAGTGYESVVGGSTGWLTTTAPVVPGEKIALQFSLHDEGDHLLDSTVLLEGFRWVIEEVQDPITVPRVPHSPARATTDIQ